MKTESRFQICFIVMGLLTGGVLLNQIPAAYADTEMSSLVREPGDVTASTGQGIVFEKTQIDLGKVPSGKDAVTEFVFRNMGSETLVIEKITSG
jgi:hypothetical protein